MKTKDKEKSVRIHVPLNGNELLRKAQDAVNKNKELYTLWKVVNVNAMDRFGITDHGVVHFQIVANISLRFSRILVKNKIKMSSVSDFGLKNDHAEVIVFLASLLHDLGMSIHREGHEEFSLFLANNLLAEILSFLPIEERTIVTSEVLHAIIGHRNYGNPRTIEAGIVRVADALDMSEGRSRIPYEEGKIDIHSVSASAIDNVEINEGKEYPIKIIITMNNSAGIFQVDELLKKKIKDSKIEKYIEVDAFVTEKHEKKLVKEYRLKHT